MLFHVYADPKPEGYFDPTTEPFGIYRQILDADWLLYILLPLLLAIVVGVLLLAWRVHEIPAHKADHKKMRQAELVSALTLLGLLEHWVWARGVVHRLYGLAGHRGLAGAHSESLAPTR